MHKSERGGGKGNKEQKNKNQDVCSLEKVRIYTLLQMLGLQSESNLHRIIIMVDGLMAGASVSKLQHCSLNKKKILNLNTNNKRIKW